jgi:hypothetical protein
MPHLLQLTPMQVLRKLGGRISTVETDFKRYLQVMAKRIMGMSVKNMHVATAFHLSHARLLQVITPTNTLPQSLAMNH